MISWIWGREPKLEEHTRLHDEMLEESRKLAESAERQRQLLVARANGHLVDFTEVLGGTSDAGKSGTEL